MGTNFLPHDFRDIVDNRFNKFEKILNKNTDLVENVAEECRDKVNDLVQETMEEQLQEKFAKYDNVAQSF